MMKLPEKQLLRPDEAAALFGVTRQTVYNWCQDGTLESVKVKGVLRVTRASIEARLSAEYE